MLNEQAIYAQIALDIPSRAIDRAYDYLVPTALVSKVEIGCCALVDFANRPALGYIISLSQDPPQTVAINKLKPIRELLSTPYFDADSARLAQWIAAQYLAPLSEAIHLFTPPGSAPKIRKDAGGSWQLLHPGVGAVDDRWVHLVPSDTLYQPPRNAIKQRSIIDALRLGEMRVSDLTLEIASPAASLKALEKRGVVVIESRRRIRGTRPPLPPSQDIKDLTEGQQQALKVICDSLEVVISGSGSKGSDTKLPEEPTPNCRPGSLETNPNLAPRLPRTSTSLFCNPQFPPVILLDGVTGSGKTEVYLQAIRKVLEAGGSACVLVPEISLTPQTVSRFRSRFGEQVAVLHSRLSAGERFDQWDLIRNGSASVVVGARSALFAPLKDLRLIIIDEEHEATYKQSSSPRYSSKEVAIKRAQLTGAVVVLGSATPSMESLAAAGQLPQGTQQDKKQDIGTVPLSCFPLPCPSYQHVSLPMRASGKPLPPVQIVNLSAEFQAGNKTMYSVKLKQALQETIERGEKAVLLLNKRGFASFLLCRDCGYVPTCEQCASSYTFHENPPHLLCHHCGVSQSVPGVCPECGSPYLRQLGPGTQFAVDQLQQILPPETPIIRMDADTTSGKDGHQRCLEEFAAASTGVLLGTQMIAKGLDFADVTLVGVLIADTALKFPDFRSAERTYQLLEQVAGRAGRAQKDGRVIVQTYWPEHLAIRAAATHNRDLLLASESLTRCQLGYPPYARLANILIWGKDLEAVRLHASTLAITIKETLMNYTDIAGRLTGDISLSSSETKVTELAPQNWDGAKGIGQLDQSCSSSPVSSVPVPETPQILHQAWQLLGPSPCVLSKRQGYHRWHLLLKAPPGADIPALLAQISKSIKSPQGVSTAIDIDPQDLM